MTQPTDGRRTRPVTARQGAVLAVLAAAGEPLTPREVAEELEGTVEAARAALAALERKQLARRDNAPAPRRGRLYEPTNTGRAVADALDGVPRPGAGQGQDGPGTVPPPTR